MFSTTIVAYFASTVAIVWQWIANTDRFNKKALLKSVTRRDITLLDGSTAAEVTQLIFGWFIWARWIELKPQWETQQYFLFRRPSFEFNVLGLSIIRATIFTVRANFTPSDRSNSLTRLEYMLSLEVDKIHWSQWIARLVIPAFLLFTAIVFRTVFWFDNKAMQKGQSPTSTIPKGLRWGAKKKLGRAYHTLVIRRKKIRPLVWEGIIKYLTAEHRLRPYEIADRENLPRREVLLAFVWMMEYKIVRMAYESLCPGCRGVKATKRTLRLVERAEVCVSCQKNFQLNIHQMLEVVFQVHPRLCRMTTPPTYCIASPMHVTHIVAEVELTANGSGSRHEIPTTFAEGKYKIRVLGTSQELRFTVKEMSQGSDATVTFSVMGLLTATVEILARGHKLMLDNQSGRNRLVVIERSEWITDMVSALDLLLLKDFRILFPREVVRGGVKQALQMGSLAVMFNDLKGSTVWWQDQKKQRMAMRIITTFMKIMDRCIEKHQGTIVKTIGDAVMALFRRKSDGVRAMLEAQREFHTYCDRKNIDLRVRLGMHYGSTLLTTSIVGQLDAFNPIVNEAARLESQTDMNDRHDHVIVTEVVEGDRRFQQMKQENEISTKEFISTLKGIGERKLYRVYIGPNFGKPKFH